MQPKQVPIPTPGKPLLHLVRARFTERGESLHGWCTRHRVDWGYACRSLTGAHDFPAAQRLRERIVKAAGVGQEEQR